MEVLSVLVPVAIKLPSSIDLGRQLQVFVSALFFLARQDSRPQSPCILAKSARPSSASSLAD